MQKNFGTNSLSHPGVRFFLDTKEWFVGGKVSLIKSLFVDEEINELKPSETKKIFKKKNGKLLLVFRQEIFLIKPMNIYIELL